MHCFGCGGAGTDGRPWVSSAGHFPGCGVGRASPSLPAARNAWECRHQGTLFQLGCPGGAPPWRGDSHHDATMLSGRAVLRMSRRHPGPCPHLMLEENLVGARFCPQQSSSAWRGSQGAGGGFFPGSSQALPACSVWDTVGMDPYWGQVRQPLFVPPKVSLQFWGAALPQVP